MKTENKNLEQNCNTKRKTSLTLSCKLCIHALGSSLLAFCFLTSVSGAEIVTEQLDPTDLIMSHSAETSQDANTQNIKDDPDALKAVVQPPMHVVELPADRHQQIQTTPHTIEITPLNFTTQVEEKSPQDNFVTVSNPETLITRQLWQERITVSKDEKDRRNKDELRQIIEQIRSVEFQLQSETPEPVTVAELLSTAKPGETPPDIQATHEPEKKETEFMHQSTSGELSDEKKDAQGTGPLHYRAVTDQTLQIFEDKSQNPEQLNNPFELAEVLFLSGHLKQALACYREALKREDPDKARSGHDRAWILFQIGNCLQDVDRPKAMETYRQLIAEYPDSPWTDLAKAQDKLTDWLQNDKPAKLITERQL
jgi:TolA-binding protein